VVPAPSGGDYASHEPGHCDTAATPLGAILHRPHSPIWLSRQPQTTRPLCFRLLGSAVEPASAGHQRFSDRPPVI